MGQVYGYIRVSSRDQNEDRQVIALSEFEIPEGNLYLDKCSGKDFDRPSYQKMLKQLQRGDLLIVKSIDRLGRNYDEIKEQWYHITREIGVDIQVLDMPLLDTRQGRDLTGTLLADIVLQILSYVAQTERENIRQRQREGIAAARLRGVHLGRPRLIPPVGWRKYGKQWKRGEISSHKAAVALGVSNMTFLKWVREEMPDPPSEG